MKKVTLLIIPILCALLLVGCTKKPQNPKSTQGSKSTQVQNAHSELDNLRKSITENDCTVGIGFFGYIYSESDEEMIRECVSDSTLAKKYPFLKELKAAVFEGTELYAFVPASKDAVITVYRSEMSEEGTYIDHKDKPDYVAKPGEALILRCNLSEIYSNVLISVTDGDNVLEFHPMLSMKDGHVSTENGCFDFSVYENKDDNESELLGAAFELLTGTDEVNYALEHGMKLIYTGDTETVNGSDCFIFSLGTEHEEQFVREQLYAVSKDTVYVFYTETGEWQILGAG